MGFIKEIITDVAKDMTIKDGIGAIGAAVHVASDVSELAGELIGDAFSERIKIRKANELDKYQEKMEKLNPDNRHIWMMEESRDTKKSLIGTSTTASYKLFSVDGTIIYTAESTFTNKRQLVTLYDAAGVPIGCITEQKSKRKNPFAAKNSEKLIDLAMSFRDEEVGFVTNAVWKGKWFLTWDVVNWGAVRKKVGNNRIVTEDDELIAEITTKTFNSRKLTFLDIENAEQEKAVVLFALAIEAYGNSI